jgi:hypothetical protein
MHDQKLCPTFGGKEINVYSQIDEHCEIVLFLVTIVKH